MFYFSIILTVVSNVVYHLCQKEIRAEVNPLVSLFFTYLTGMLLTAISYPLLYSGGDLLPSIKSLNWATFALGFGIVGLELGFLLVYRSGWNISLASLFSNMMVALILIPVGCLFYKDVFTVRHICGAAFAILGLLLLARK